MNIYGNSVGRVSAKAISLKKQEPEEGDEKRISLANVYVQDEKEAKQQPSAWT